MRPPKLRQRLIFALDLLHALRYNTKDHSLGLAQLEAILVELTLGQAEGQTPSLDAFWALQERFDANIAVRLIDWLGRTIDYQQAHSHQTAAAEFELIQSNVDRCLRVLQGALLLHRPSQRLFARRATLEYLLALLDLYRPSHLHSPLLPSPSSPLRSPVALPMAHQSTPSPTPSSSGTKSLNEPLDVVSRVLFSTLETIQVALVDRPENLRVFEQVGGLGAIVRVLKDKSISQQVRIKTLEVLYYYLLPEQPRAARPQRSPSATSSAYSLSPAPSSVAFSSPEQSPQPRPPRARTPPPLSALAQATEGFVPETPRKVERTPRTSAPTTPSSSSSRLRASVATDTPRRRPLTSDSDASSTASPRRPRPISYDGGASSSALRRAEEALRDVGREPPLTPRRAHLHRRGESVDAVGLRASSSASSSSSRDGGSRVRGVVSDLEERIRKSLKSDQQPAFSLDPPPSPRKSASAQRLAHSSDPSSGAHFRRSQTGQSTSVKTGPGRMGPPSLPGSRAHHQRSPSMIDSSAGEDEVADREDNTPRARRRKSAIIDGTPRGPRPSGVPVVEVREATPQKRGSSPRQRLSESRRKERGSPSLSASEAEEVGMSRGDGTRTEEEKRQLLRYLMPNIDALQARFENLGWRDGLQ